MPEKILVSIVIAAIVLSVIVGAYALFRGRNYKKNYFLLMQGMMVLYLFGFLLEITGAAEEAYVGIKLLNAGASFVTAFAFFFVADYCDIELHPVYVKMPIMAVPVILSVIIWSPLHSLVYRDYGIAAEFARFPDFSPGPLYFLTYAYPLACMISALILLLHQIKSWKNKYRAQLLLLLACLSIPLATDAAYYAALLLNMNAKYLTPYSAAFVGVLLYMGVMRFNIFEIISIPTESAMEHMREGFVLVDEDNSFLYANPAAMKILPGLSKLIKGESVYAANDWPGELRSIAGNTVDFPVDDRCGRYFRASISQVFTEHRNPVAKVILFGEITDSINLMKELENAAYMDSLTGLYNRKHFYKLANVDIERALRTNRSIYAAMLDLDFFKNINDTHGHAAGDAVLRTTAGVIRQTIRSYDLLGRYGGEEFVLLITDLDGPVTRRLMERIRENMERCVTNYEGAELKVTCSIGLAKFSEGDSLEAAIKKADDALYAAKNSGRNRVMLYG